LHFIRYAPLVKQRGGTVLVQCPKALLPLLRSCPGIDRLLAAAPAVDEPFDVQAPLLSLPGIFGTTRATIPAPVPYLAADAGLVKHWRAQLSRLPGFKIGIAWDTDPRFRRFNSKRCIPLKQFAPLAQLPGVHLISLQKGRGEEQL